MKKLNIKKLLRGTGFFFTSASVVKTIAVTVANLIILRWIGPDELGVWKAVILFQTYVQFMSLGSTQALNRELPYLIGKNQRSKALELAKTTQFIALTNVALTLLAVAGALVYVGLQSAVDRETWSLTILAAGMVIGTGFFQNYLSVTFRAGQEFRTLAKIHWIQSLIVLLGLGIVYLYRYEGYLLYNILVGCTYLFMTFMMRPLRVSVGFSYSDFLHLLKKGVPLYFFQYMQGVAKSLVKVVVLYVGGATSLGLFTPALAIQNILALLPKYVGQYLYPKMSMEYGKTNDKSNMWPVVKNVMLLNLGAGLIFSIVAYPLIPFFFELIFPLYTEATQAAQIMALTVGFMGSSIAMYSLYTLESYRLLTMIVALKLLLFSALPYLFGLYLHQLTGAALGVLVAEGLLFVMIFFLLKKELHK